VVVSAPRPADSHQLGPQRLFDLTGKTVLVTGGTRGLGRAMVTGFAAAGARLIVSSRDEQACRRVADELGEQGTAAVGIACHVGRWEQVAQLSEAAISAFGRVDVLVNNAGMSPVYPSVTDVTEDLFDKTIAVNLKGPFRLGALLGQHMVDRGGGVILNVGSTGSVRPTRDFVPYAAAKAGVVAMTMGFADAFAPSVRVNTLVPGRFHTDVTRGWSADELSGAGSRVGRIGSPGEVVGAALYLVSEASSYATGSMLVVDGGRF